MASIYGFSSDDAKRIGAAVRAVEGNKINRSAGGQDFAGPNPGVRLLLAKHESTSGWATGSTAIVTVHAGDPIASVQTLIAKNHFLKFPTNTACTQRWVALSNNGFGWYAVNQRGECVSTCQSEYNGVDFASIPGYQKTATQFLGHLGGCIKWFDTVTCVTAA